jgi:hypothetical protein
MDMLIALLPEILKSEHALTLIHQLIFFMIAWGMVKKEVRNQFFSLREEMRTGFDKMADRITMVEKSHSMRLEKIEAIIQPNIFKEK